MIGFDIDGVIREFPENYNEMQPNDWCEYTLNCPPKLHPESVTSGEYVLITATKKDEKNFRIILVHWLKDNGIKPKEIYWLKGKRSFNTIVEHKAGIINKLKLSTFYEDDPRMCSKLKTLCPLCKIVYVPSNYAKIMKIRTDKY